MLYTCNFPTCAAQAQIIKNDLARIGLRVVVKEAAPSVIYGLAQRRTYPFDLALGNLGTRLSRSGVDARRNARQPLLLSNLR